jgi:hypothetical protein
VGFWDASIGDLEAVGIHVDGFEYNVLERGGVVLVLQRLLSPYHWFGDTDGMNDQDGQPIFVPAMMTVHPLTARIEPRTSKDNTTYRQYLENEYGERWREWPSYVGTVQAAVEDRFNDGDPTFTRVWNGMVITTAQEAYAAQDINRACRQRINDSLYGELSAVFEFESYGDYCMDDLIEAERHPKREDYSYYYDDLDSEYANDVLEAYKKLQKGQHIVPVHQEGPVKIEAHPIEFKPVEYYLQNSSLALSMWRRMVHRKQMAEYQISAALPPSLSAHFNYVERHYVA